MKKVYIVSATRTPIGGFGGALSAIPSPLLGGHAMAAAIDRANTTQDAIQAVYMGCAIQAGLGQAPARQAAFAANLPEHVPCTTINKVCGSGLDAVIAASRAIMLGEIDIAVAGGMENMSAVPYGLAKARYGYRLGHGEVCDLLLNDALRNAYDGMHMGTCVDIIAEAERISRDAQDDFAVRSYTLANTARRDGLTADEIVPVASKRKNADVSVDTDESPLIFDETKLRRLKPAFRDNGTITAGNASSINDGSAALLLAGEEAVRARNLAPVARIVAYAYAATAPNRFPYAPIQAIQTVLNTTDLSVDDIDVFEINEAFAVVPLLAMTHLSIPLDRVNPRGGAVSLGHPIGASGARILTTLVHTMRQTDSQKGLAAICIGGGEGIAMIVERTQ
jgi:acetyl-CoA C-acetyltransferase